MNSSAQNSGKGWRATAIVALCMAVTVVTPGCAPLVLGSAATSLSVIHDRRTFGVLVEDQTVELKAVGALINNPLFEDRLDVSATSYNLQVLLTGQAIDEEARTRYAEWVAHIPSIRKVYNEIQVGPFSTVRDKADDAYLTSKVNLALINIRQRGFDPSRVKVISERGVVYLMGLLKPQEEQAVEDTVRYIEGVRQVVKIIEPI